MNSNGTILKRVHTTPGGRILGTIDLVQERPNSFDRLAVRVNTRKLRVLGIREVETLRKLGDRNDADGVDERLDSRSKVKMNLLTTRLRC